MNIRKLSSLQVIGIIILGIGFIPVFYGLPILFEAESKSETIRVNGTEVRIHELTSINLFPSTTHNGEKLVDRIKVNFDTLVIFEGENIEVTSSATGVNEKYVTGIFVLLVTPSLDFKNMPVDDLAEEVERLVNFKKALVLTQESNPPWKTRLAVPFLESGQKIMVQTVIEVNGTIAYRVYSYNEITTVNPAIDKLSSEADKAIMELVEKIEISNYEQQRTNRILIGIGYVGIGIVIIIGAIDVLVMKTRRSQILK